MRKKIFSLIFVSLFMILSLVGGTLILNADSIFLASTTTSSDTDEKDHEVKAQASGNWSDYTNDYWTPGEKNGRVVYVIESAKQLATLARQCNNGVGLHDNRNGGSTYYSVCGRSGYNAIDVYLEKDIDMSAHYWDCPIGNGSYQFCVNFYGQGYKISGLNFYTYYEDSNITGKLTAKDGVYGIGLFGVVAGDIYIRDLYIDNGSVYLNGGTSTIRMSVGGVVGYSVGVLRMENVVYTGSVENIYSDCGKTSYLGGLIGYSSIAYPTNCFNYATVHAYNGTSMAIGGIVGSAGAGGVISNSGNFGEVTCTLRTGNTSLGGGSGYGYGGIVGYVGGGGSAIYDCVNYGEVKANGYSSYVSYRVAGIAGYIYKTSYINRCVNYGSIAGSNWVGGILGDMDGGSSIAIANCINYGDVKGSTSGKVVGWWSSGSVGNIRGCYIIGSSASEGVGISGDSYGSDNIWTYTDGTIYRAKFIRCEYAHALNFSGNLAGHNISGWGTSVASLNFKVGSASWVITPLLYDYYGGSGHSFNRSYPYSLVPSSLVGTGLLDTKYYRNGTETSYNFDGDEQDRKVMSVTFNKISGDSVSAENIGYTGATFAYIKGLSNSTRNSLKFSYNSSYFSAYSASSGTTGVRNVSLSETSKTLANGFNRETKLNFVAGSDVSSAIFYANFQSKQKSIVTKYKIGTAVDGSTTSNARYDFNNGESLSGSHSRNFFSSKNYQTMAYYKEQLSLSVTPKYGYAVLYVLNKSSTDSDDYDASKSVATNKPLYEYFDSGKISLIKPSVYGETSASFKYHYGEIVLYVVPIQYGLYVKTKFDDSSTRSGGGLYAYNGDKGVSGLSSTSRTVYLSSSYVSDKVNEIKYTGYQMPKIPNNISYGYSYQLYAYCTNVDDVDSSASKRLLTINNGLHNQLNTSQEISFKFVDAIEKAVQGINSNRSNTSLYIIVKRTKLDYKINFVNMRDSYLNPNSYTTENGNLGGVSTPTSSEKFDVDKTVSYKFDSNYGYKNIGSSYTDSSTFISSGLMTSSQGKVSFKDILNDYLKTVCGEKGYDVTNSRISSRTLTIYVYYKLQKYDLDYSAVIYDTDGGNVSGPTAASFTFSSENSTQLDKTRQVYYFAPTTLEVKDVTNANFLGWYLGNGNDEKLLSLSKQYNFLMNPSVIGSDSTKSDGGHKINLYAKFARYHYQRGVLNTAGSSKVVKIKTAEDLIMLSSNVRNGQTYEGCLIQLENDIDMSDKVFSPIGTQTTPFKGIFDGQNHIISNLRFVGCNVKYRQNLYDIGMFGYTENATIKNLTIRNSDFNAFGNAGAFVANAKDTVMEHLNNYRSNLVLSKVEFYDVYGSEIGSEVSGKSFDYSRRGEKEMMTTNPTELSGVSHVATLYTVARENLGGLVGKMEGTESSIFACSVNADVSGNSDALTTYTHGLVGRKSAGTIDQSCVENGANNSTISITNVNDKGEMIGVTDSYYRRKTNTNTYATEYVYEQSLTTVNPSSDKTNWFKLANGLWTLRVLYWN